ncbi:MAG: hypothetical protein V1696_00475 [Candidatus Jorgensenbacteria bacterium]
MTRGFCSKNIDYYARFGALLTKRIIPIAFEVYETNVAKEKNDIKARATRIGLPLHGSPKVRMSSTRDIAMT